MPPLDRSASAPLPVGTALLADAALSLLAWDILLRVGLHLARLWPLRAAL